MESNYISLAIKAIEEIHGLSKVYIGIEKPNTPGYVFRSLVDGEVTFHWSSSTNDPEIQDKVDEFLDKNMDVSVSSMFWQDSPVHPFPFDKNITVTQNDGV